MAGFGTLAAVHTSFHIGSRSAIHVLGEIRHRPSQSLVLIIITLRIMARMRVFDSQSLFVCVQGIFFSDFAHTLAPLRVNVTPVVYREPKTMMECMSLPNGNQIRNASKLRMCIARRVS